MAIDQYIIKGCKKKEYKAQQALYKQCLDRVYFTIRRYVSDEFYIENIIQDTFIKVYKNIDRYDPNIAKFETWISAIAIRESINHLRKRAFEFKELDNCKTIAEKKATPLEQLQAEDILNTLSSLPETHRTVFSLYEIDGYSHREIGDLLGVTESTSRSYLTRAKIIFREYLTKMNYVTHD